MIAIRNYNDTKIELNVAKTELNRLIDKKERLYNRYFGTTINSPATREITIIDKKTSKKRTEYRLKDENALLKGTHIKTDPMTDYMVELEKIDDITGKSLNKALQDQQNEVGILEYYLRAMDDDMAKLKGIEYRLYYEIVINPNNANKTVSKIIEEFAEKEDVNKEVNTIWVNYYPNIKKYLEKLQLSSENQVNNVINSKM